MNSSPFFRAAIIALTVLVLAVIGILNNAAYSATTEMRHAPVIEAQGHDGVRKQIGWFTYEKQDDAVVLYCVPQGATTLACAIFVVTDKGNAVVIVDGITATEQRT